MIVLIPVRPAFEAKTLKRKALQMQIRFFTCRPACFALKVSYSVDTLHCTYIVCDNTVCKIQFAPEKSKILYA